MLDKREIVKELVTKYLEKNINIAFPLGIYETDHIINTGVSVLCTKWNVDYPGGGFVQAIVDNDLLGAVGRGDIDNLMALKFYVMLMINIGMPTELLED